MTTHQPVELPIACTVCGEVTRHKCPFEGAPLERWECEHARAHAPAEPRWDLFLLAARARPSRLN